MNEDNVSYYAVIPANVRYDSELTPNAKLLYGEITALCNAKGYCWASNDYFAKLYHVKKWTISNWISQLVKKGYIISEIKYKEDSRLIEERRLRLPEPLGCCENQQYPIVKNHNTLYGKSTIPYCENSHDPIVKNHTENNTYNTTINNKNNINAEFEELWQLYPRKEGKKSALAAYKKAVKAGTTKEEIKSGILKYIEYIKATETPTQYIKHGSTFFNQECWNDDFSTEGVKKNEYDWFSGSSAASEATESQFSEFTF